jgi:hypothetical protein
VSDKALKYDSKKPQMYLIPTSALEEEARVWTFGMAKYAAFNWNKGLKYSRIVSAMMRHTAAINKGEMVDPESKCLHAAHIRCCAAMLIEFTMTHRTELDDLMNSESDKGGSHGTGDFK